MATSQPSSGIQDIVCCSICMEQFDNERHVPNILPCEHTFCKSCINSMAKGYIPGDFSCPICRTPHRVPNHGFTVNRVVLEMVEELQKSAANVVNCAEHSNMECGVVCIDCFVFLCCKCLMQTKHHSHHLEELSKAKPLLTQKLKDMIKQQQDAVERKNREINGTPYSAAEIQKATENISSVTNKAKSAIDKWKEEQFSVLHNLRTKVQSQEKELIKAKQSLQFIQADDDIGSLFEKLKRACANHTKALKPLDLPRDGTYNLNDRCETLLETLQSIVSPRALLPRKLLMNTTPSGSSESRTCSSAVSSKTDNSGVRINVPKEKNARDVHEQSRPRDKRSSSRSRSRSRSKDWRPQQRSNFLKRRHSSSSSSSQSPQLKLKKRPSVPGVAMSNPERTCRLRSPSTSSSMSQSTSPERTCRQRSSSSSSSTSRSPSPWYTRRWRSQNSSSSQSLSPSPEPKPRQTGISHRGLGEGTSQRRQSPRHPERTRMRSCVGSVAPVGSSRKY